MRNRNLNDLLCTLNFDVVPTATKEPSTIRPTSNTTPPEVQVLAISSDDSSHTVSQKVVTQPTSNLISVNVAEPEMPDSSIHTTPIPSVDIACKVVTPTSNLHTPDNRFPCTHELIGSDGVASKDNDREVVTPTLPQNVKSASDSYTDNGNNVVTPKTPRMPSHSSNTEDVIRAALMTPSVKTVHTSTPAVRNLSNSEDSSSQVSSTPRSVITDPDHQELETANALLQLGGTA